MILDFPSIKVGKFVIKELIIPGVHGSYTGVVLVFSSDDWIVMKDLDVFVQVGTTDHPAKLIQWLGYLKN